MRRSVSGMKDESDILLTITYLIKNISRTSDRDLLVVRRLSVPSAYFFFHNMTASNAFIFSWCGHFQRQQRGDGLR